jgi:hypothetical protein
MQTTLMEVNVTLISFADATSAQEYYTKGVNITLIALLLLHLFPMGPPFNQEDYSSEDHPYSINHNHGGTVECPPLLN